MQTPTDLEGTDLVQGSEQNREEYRQAEPHMKFQVMLPSVRQSKTDERRGESVHVH